MVRTRRQTIQVWASRHGNVDPRTHYWVRAGGELQRICDDEALSGPPTPEGDLGYLVLCSKCEAMAVDDAVHGRGMFKIRNRLPGARGNGGYSPLHEGGGVLHEGGGCCMKGIIEGNA